MKRNLNFLLACCLGGGLLLAQPLRANVMFTVENAGVQATTVPDTITETFNSVPMGSVSIYVSPIGTISGGAIVGANIYGGALGIGNFYGDGNQSGTASATLTFNSAQTFFGLWWSAMDSQNVLKFFDGATLVGTFTTADIVPSLTSAYYGNPNGGGDSGEPFAYVDFTGTAGTQFTSVEFDNNTTTATGFEVDNLSILACNVPDAANTGFMFLIAVTALFGYRQFSRCRA
jgi:hypothetical protein